MKLEFDTDDNELVLDLMASIFIGLLKRELKDSQEALPKFKHPGDIKMYKRNIKACKVLLDYYGGLDD